MEDFFKKVIEDRKFNFWEIQGFRVRPDLALMAGVAIGYQLGIDEGIKAVNDLVSRVNINELNKE